MKWWQAMRTNSTDAGSFAVPAGTSYLHTIYLINGRAAVAFSHVTAVNLSAYRGKGLSDAGVCTQIKLSLSLICYEVS